MKTKIKINMMTTPHDCPEREGNNRNQIEIKRNVKNPKQREREREMKPLNMREGERVWRR